MSEETGSICPRCGAGGVDVLFESPVTGVWEVRQCDTCLYTWRTSEPPRRSDRAHYPDAFRMTEADMNHAEAIPTVPPLKVSDRE
ncbi:Phenolic acid decarboxylase subunit D [wastewater metagenome]|uniref:Phenolic acid decarboxylase subunit D n=2 Tax=unclassified sequences TaxID=12908 RepID=A0A5B8R9E1_9ZZZZ|nr:non-oxidative hydroxyarylic acid decarboxylases subunit D [Arhodomonas sp. KWT]QEA05171.1 phenolic acid decarboxylase subunit D [uncultured organism]